MTPLLDRVTLGVLVFDGFLSAVLGVLFLPTYLGAVAFPISALISGLANVVLVLIARTITGPTRRAGWPLVGWGAGFLLCALGGPGGDVLLIQSWQSLLLLALGLVPAGYLIFRDMAAPVAR
ncbi:hypothetical protein OG921_11485 [Aldersonia sp. NBC_00410]|uniref:hypothetical protein n=1 Tax=Aldersonia sp. NBC_00410 TaxID=2975954 RepID=UPI0022538AEE|nr:hypothetical protein [Aldersonia sp. NBC_00410]MCX5043788.1 hypothetical protein [Aldersonia sp. NBC_00410]